MKKKSVIAILLAFVVIVVVLVVVVSKARGESRPALKGLPTSPPPVSPLLQPLRDAVWDHYSDNCWEFNRWIRVTLMDAIREMQLRVDQHRAANPTTPPGQEQAARAAAQILYPALMKGREELARCGPDARYTDGDKTDLIAKDFGELLKMSYTELEELLVDLAT